jgi:hypothetical protein
MDKNERVKEAKGGGKFPAPPPGTVVQNAARFEKALAKRWTEEELDKLRQEGNGYWPHFENLLVFSDGLHLCIVRCVDAKGKDCLCVTAGVDTGSELDKCLTAMRNSELPWNWLRGLVEGRYMLISGLRELEFVAWQTDNNAGIWRGKI